VVQGLLPAFRALGLQLDGAFTDSWGVRLCGWS
ncbi:unnamed protein product, partial [Allacma fusca]